ncbi:MAG: O-antigen ligase family protein, partial [Candidatus Lokiarchaeota archaeon]|nr:O-antigen ligase family protein [Candidatus Lokiarchaeota archaeon]
YYSIKKKSIVFILLSSFILVGTSFIVLKNINPDIEKRTSKIENLEKSIDKEGYVQNSLITRAMIWTTAYNAFKAHPIIGIGSHSFRYQSKKYSTLHPLMYKLYVERATPHGTYFTIPPETGIVGLLSFLIMTFLIFRHSYSNIIISKNIEDKKISTILFFLLVYINFSMVITDAWLWGTSAILWGIVLGLNVLHSKKLLQKSKGLV